MAEFLLIHGACHGAWCWRDVLPRLIAAGHSVRAIDLPAAGDDETPPEAVTLADYRDRVLSAIDDRAILVGHSLGGVSIAAAAAAAPDRVAALVYLAAWAPTKGERARDLRVRYGCETLLGAIRMSEDRSSSTFDEASLQPIFYHDCPDGTVDYARPRLKPQPTLPSTEPAAAVPDQVVRHYIRCLGDRAIPAAAQIDMSRTWPADRVHDLDCGHSPFFAQPDRLAGLLDAISETP